MQLCKVLLQKAIKSDAFTGIQHVAIIVNVMIRVKRIHSLRIMCTVRGKTCIRNEKLSTKEIDKVQVILQITYRTEYYINYVYN